jgi:hypothetical protein
MNVDRYKYIVPKLHTHSHIQCTPNEQQSTQHHKPTFIHTYIDIW